MIEYTMTTLDIMIESVNKIKPITNQLIKFSFYKYNMIHDKKYKKYKTKYQNMVLGNDLITRFVMDNIDSDYLNILINSFGLDKSFLLKKKLLMLVK